MISTLLVATLLGGTPLSAADAQKAMAQSMSPVDTVKGCRVTVTTSPTILTCSLSGARVRIIKNCDASVAIYIGASDVTTSGYTLDHGENFVFNPAIGTVPNVGASLSVYGIVASSTAVMCVFEGK
jgi:hypothetical protein